MSCHFRWNLRILGMEISASNSSEINACKAQSFTAKNLAKLMTSDFPLMFIVL